MVGKIKRKGNDLGLGRKEKEMTIKELKEMVIEETKVIETHRNRNENDEEQYSISELIGILKVASKMGKLWIYDEEENIVIEYNKRKGTWESIDKKAGY